MISRPPRTAIHSMASIPPSYYHASAAILIANHGDFFNTHGILQQLQDDAARNASKATDSGS
jgi:hypothetical protein